MDSVARCLRSAFTYQLNLGENGECVPHKQIMKIQLDRRLRNLCKELTVNRVTKVIKRVLLMALFGKELR